MTWLSPLVAWCLVIGVQAKVIPLPPGSSNPALLKAMDNASEGDTIRVNGGNFEGPLFLNKGIHLVGRNWPVMDGNGEGTVLTITAPGASLKGFVIRGSGASLNRENSGIAVEAPNVTLKGNRLEETLFGIYLRKAHGTVIRANRIEGKDLAVPRRGDPIRVWYSNDVRIEDNHVSHGRDVVLWYSSDLHVAGNLVHDGRYGLHFMYCDDALIVSNRLTRNSVGAFLMYSRRLHMLRNTVAHNRGPSGYGIGMKDMDDAVVEQTLFVGNRVGAYIDNSPRELNSTTWFSSCVFAYNDTGVRLLPSVRRNFYIQNSFISNLEQVAVTGGGVVAENHWTHHGKGNYWSDYVGYDANGDGLGDLAYQSKRFFEQIMDNKPTFRLFVNSPAAGALDFAAHAFPLFQPQPKLTDERPLMAPIIPKGLPALHRPSTARMGFSSLALVCLGLTLALGLARLPREKEEATHESNEAPRNSKLLEQTEADDVMHSVNVNQLRMKFGNVVALDDVSFDIPAGQSVALWGPNGAGKTTLLRCLLGLLPYQGDVNVGGYNTRRDGKSARRRIGFVPQELHFQDNMSVRETLSFYARLRKASTSEWQALAERLEVNDQLKKQIRELSGGMRQRLALATALLGDPPLLLLDEPTANLDLQSRDRFLHLLQNLKDDGKTLVFCSHHLDEVSLTAERIIVLEEGRLCADCPPAELDRRLGWQSHVWLKVAEDQTDLAMETLMKAGLSPRRRHRGVIVPVVSCEKAKPIHVLTGAGLSVDDFSYSMEKQEAAVAQHKGGGHD